MRNMFLWEFVVFEMILNDDLCMIFSCLAYDAQFFLYNIYNSGKRMSDV